MKASRISLLAALIAGTLAAYTPTGFAQDANPAKPAPNREGAPGGQRGEAAKERINKLAEELKLTEDQKTKVEAALKAQQEKMRGVREASTAPQERQEKVKAVREELTKTMKGILTPEQFAQWEKMPQGRGPGGQGRPGGPGGNPKADTKGAGPKAE